uniref:MFS transporter n=1 Tax=Phenylobacterium glaciei TaxID=2803784 RepID=A0A974S9W3_9CAUL|nr:MFS transporter [Phenylobacterium glaciei]
MFKGFGFNTFLLFFYSQVLGAPPVLVATAIALTTVLDGAVDPLIGSFSDNLKSRLGRRHPLMYASVLPLVLGLYLVFSPPPASTTTACLPGSSPPPPWSASPSACSACPGRR